MSEAICRDCDFTGTFREAAKHATEKTGREPLPGVALTHQIQPGTDFIEPEPNAAFEALLARTWEALLAFGNPEGITLDVARRKLMFNFAVFAPKMFSGEK